MNATQKPEILVTGAGGALAQAVIKRLKPDYRVVMVDFRRQVPAEDGMASYRVDYDKYGFREIFNRHQIEGVVHLGRVGLYQLNMRNRYNHNVLGTQQLLDLCRSHGVGRVFLLSTYFVYGASPFNPTRLTEDAPLKATEITKDLVDTVELENLCNIYLWKYPELNIRVLRPCNIVGPGVLNSISLLLSSRWVPVLVGFAPHMQFIHVSDVARAVVVAFKGEHSGVFNLTGDEAIPYPEMARQCGCRRLPIPALPGVLPKFLSQRLDWKGWPPYLVNFFKYPVLLDGSAFNQTFDFYCEYRVEDIATHYADLKLKAKLGEGL